MQREDILDLTDGKKGGEEKQEKLKSLQTGINDE